MIGSSLAVLGRSGEEETVADGLVDSLLRVHGGLLAISQAHAAQDEDSPNDRKQPPDPPAALSCVGASL